MAVAKAKVGGDGRTRADGTAEGRGQILLETVSLEIADNGLETIARQFSEENEYEHSSTIIIEAIFKHRTWVAVTKAKVGDMEVGGRMEEGLGLRERRRRWGRGRLEGG